MIRAGLCAATALGVCVALAACSAEEEVPTQAVKAKITEAIQAKEGKLTLTNPQTDQPISMEFDHVHEAVHKTPGGRYVACVDFQGSDGTIYDVDYYVDRENGGLAVEDVVMHKAGEATVIRDSMRDRLENKK